MIPLAIRDVARLCSGRLERATGTGEDTEITGLEIDSRRVGSGDLFVAIGGGVQYVSAALDGGAAAALVPHDAHEAMAALGRAVRDRSSARVVGITGATGKTSTKDILTALCRPHRRTVAAEQSHNNEIGLPLTVTRIERETEIAIVEMGARGTGQIRELCRIARPEIAVITQLGPAHLELFGSVEAIAATEAEIVAELPAGGTVCAPMNEPLLEPHLARSDVEVVHYGPGGDVDFVELELGHEETRMQVDVGGERVELAFPFRSRHNATNALAALAAYRALGLPLAEAQAGAGSVTLSRWREEELPLGGGGLLINDCYNANPVSMAAALEHLVRRAGPRRRVAVLGDMAELGREAGRYHAELGAAAGDAGVEVLVAAGELAHGYLDGGAAIPVRVWAPSAEEAVPLVLDLLRPGDCVLVKGSRAVGLEIVADALVAAAVA